jgi:hypothetical protein
MVPMAGAESSMKETTPCKMDETGKVDGCQRSTYLISLSTSFNAHTFFSMLLNGAGQTKHLPDHMQFHVSG